uniref:Uncharacterized protein n=1 Tax=Rhizophora mucronata TaxID=61149 RepID=A0A2P2LAX7_RHIMU
MLQSGQGCFSEALNAFLFEKSMLVVQLMFILWWNWLLSQQLLTIWLENNPTRKLEEGMVVISV